MARDTFKPGGVGMGLNGIPCPVGSKAGLAASQRSDGLERRYRRLGCGLLLGYPYADFLRRDFPLIGPACNVGAFETLIQCQAAGLVACGVQQQGKG